MVTVVLMKRSWIEPPEWTEGPSLDAPPQACAKKNSEASAEYNFEDESAPQGTEADSQCSTTIPEESTGRAVTEPGTSDAGASTQPRRYLSRQRAKPDRLSASLGK